MLFVCEGRGGDQCGAEITFERDEADRRLLPRFRDDRTRIKGSAVNVYTDLLKGETETWDRRKGEVVKGLCGIKPSLIICDVSDPTPLSLFIPDLSASSP